MHTLDFICFLGHIESNQHLNLSFKQMAQKRFYCSDLGEYYQDCLKIEAALKNNTLANEAASLLRAKLMERTDKREAMVKYMAGRRNISQDEMWRRLLSGDFQISEDEKQTIQGEDPE